MLARLLSTAALAAVTLIPSAFAQEKPAPASTPERIKITVLGEVAKPGRYELRKDASLLDAIASAGNLTRGASKAAFYVHRQGKVSKIDIKALIRGNPEANVLLEDGDSVFVPADPPRRRNGFAPRLIPGFNALPANRDRIEITVLGAVAKPGRYKSKAPAPAL
jgi:protein involved in polysaccharide export with SLBB domain